MSRTYKGKPVVDLQSQIGELLLTFKKKHLKYTFPNFWTEHLPPFSSSKYSVFQFSGRNLPNFGPYAKEKAAVLAERKQNEVKIEN